MIRHISRCCQYLTSSLLPVSSRTHMIRSGLCSVTHRERSLHIQNGSKDRGLFSEEEMKRRLNLLRQHMIDKDIDGVLLTSYHNINYFSSFLFMSFGRPFGLVVMQDKCMTVTPKVDGGHPWRRTHGDNMVYTDWHRDNFYHVVQLQLGDVRGRIGMEFDDLTFDTYRKMRQALPMSEMVDVSGAAADIRTIKSKEEQEVIRQGARIADVGGYAALEALEDGAPEYIMANASTKAMVEEIAKTYPNSELRDTWSWFQSEINTDGCHNPVTSRRVTSGDVISLNCFPMIDGYYAALERTVFLNRVPSQRHLEVWEINCRVHERGIELIKPGARCCDITAELNDIYRQHDLLQYRAFGYGHSFGPMSHYYGRGSAVEFREDVDTVLAEGMVVSMEPMIMLPDSEPGAGGYREHDILILTPDGAENITRFPFGPEHLIVSK